MSLHWLVKNISQGFQNWMLLCNFCLPQGSRNCNILLITKKKQTLSGGLIVWPDSPQSAFIFCRINTFCRDFRSITVVWGMLLYILITPCTLLQSSFYLYLIFIFCCLFSSLKESAYPFVCLIPSTCCSSQHISDYV